MRDITQLRTIIETRLGRDLGDYVHDLRTEGKSWRAIEADLLDRTGVTISHETLRTRIGQRAEATR